MPCVASSCQFARQHERKKNRRNKTLFVASSKKKKKIRRVRARARLRKVREREKVRSHGATICARSRDSEARELCARTYTGCLGSRALSLHDRR